MELIQYSAKLAMESNETFKCAVCFERLSRPIKFCKVGHLYCQQCQEKLNDCAVCHLDFSEDVNVTLEHILENSTFPCKNEMFGCKIFAKYTEINLHENINCDYKKIQCGLNADISNNTCNEICKLCDYEEHVRNNHLCREITSIGKEIRRDIIIDFNNRQFRRAEVIQILREDDCEDSVFFLEKIAYNNQNSVINISYHYMGLIKDAEKFQYHLTIKEDKNPILYMTHQNQVLQMGLSDENIKNSGKSLLMNLKTFMNVNERRKILNLTLQLNYTEKEQKYILNSKYFLNTFKNKEKNPRKKFAKSQLEEISENENFSHNGVDQDSTDEIDTTPKKKNEKPLEIEEFVDAKEEIIDYVEKPFAAKGNKKVKNENSVMDFIQKWLSILLSVFAFLMQIIIYLYLLK